MQLSKKTLQRSIDAQIEIGTNCETFWRLSPQTHRVQERNASKVKFGRKLVNSRQPFVEENQKKSLLTKKIQKLEERHVPGGNEWRLEGKKEGVDHTERIF